VLERFFDEAGGMQLVVHSPFGSRVNRAWGLALRKRFCRSFNFELQAAATALALPRFRGGRKVPAPLARMAAEDLLAAVFPDQVACAENLSGELEIPDHPLIRQ